jgi:hypothetical protein
MGDAMIHNLEVRMKSSFPFKTTLKLFYQPNSHSQSITLFSCCMCVYLLNCESGNDWNAMGIVEKWSFWVKLQNPVRLSVTLAQRAGVLAAASYSVAATCVFVPVTKFQNLGKLFLTLLILFLGTVRKVSFS